MCPIERRRPFCVELLARQCLAAPGTVTSGNTA